MKVVIACGGTGGHLFPGLAVGEVLLARKHDVLLLVSEKEIDRLAMEGRVGFEVRQLPSTGLPRGFSIQTLRFFSRLIQAKSFCRKLYAEWTPDVVLAMGGFTSAAPIWEARRRWIPSVIHEANVIPGRANRLLAKSVARVVVGFREAAAAFERGAGANKVVFGGTPVRSEIRSKPDRAAALAELGFETGRKTILVMGGSQGARGLNSLVLEALGALKGEPLQWAHLTGKGEEARAEAAYRTHGFGARVWPFFSGMQKLYAAADLVIARSGASSITEINYFGLPAIYIPYPFAADRHQSANAKVQVDGGAGVCFEESDLTGERLAGEIRKLTGDPQKLAAMAASSRRLSVDDAAERLADLLCELGGQKK
jgi:UDP-N-acetylglucosamine--N-acetylmuramyl-(pentapeptide) pyrophosphoryl-undecaprenol N-acetylglucosamine transferase